MGLESAAADRRRPSPLTAAVRRWLRGADDRPVRVVGDADGRCRLLRGRAALLCRQHEAGMANQMVLIWSQSGWYKRGQVEMPPAIHSGFLPCSPELQPAERLWPLVIESLANRALADLDVMETTPCERCNGLDNQADQVRALAQLRWWSVPPQNPNQSPLFGITHPAPTMTSTTRAAD